VHGHAAVFEEPRLVGDRAEELRDELLAVYVLLHLRDESQLGVDWSQCWVLTDDVRREQVAHHCPMITWGRRPEDLGLRLPGMYSSKIPSVGRRGHESPPFVKAGFVK